MLNHSHKKRKELGHPILFTGVIAPKPLKLGSIGSPTQQKQECLPGKVENGKYPELKSNGSRNYGWMVLLQAM